jgi:Pao retrotransposon peptidase/Family of unknown function (DUF5641)/Protein of unknown function (DUF1759)/Putative peptidase (DUF1758)/Integrase zinc binding domain
MKAPEKDTHIAILQGHARTLKFHRDYFTRTDETTITLDGYETRLESIVPMFEHYTEYFSPLYAALKEEEHAAWDHHVDDFTTGYFNIVTMIREKIREKKNALQANAQAPQIQQSSSVARTPKIPLETFDGSSDKWIRFRDIYESMIHNKTNLSNIEKFSYLHASIKLPPGQANVLDSFKVCEEDYQAAWKAVCDRYNDKRKIITMHCATLFEVKKMSCESASEIRRIIDAFSSQLSALKQLGYALGEADDIANVFVVQFALARLDENTLREWKKFHTEDTATWKQLKEFLTVQWRSIDDDAMEHLKTSSESETMENALKSLVVSNTNTQSRPSNIKCPVCFEAHLLWSCPKFKLMSVDERHKIVQNNRLCMNCFNPAHIARQCTSKHRCKTCDKPHHTMLHFDKSIGSDPFRFEQNPGFSAETKPFVPFQMTKTTNEAPGTSKSNIALVSCHSFVPRRRNTFLSTIVIEVKDEEGRFQEARALLDNGSEDNLMTESLARKLGIKCTDVNLRLTGVGEKTSSVKQQTSATISSRYGHFQRKIDFSVLPSITSNVPSQSGSIARAEIPESLFLADPTFNTAGKVDMLLNIDVFYDSLLEGKAKLQDGPKMLHTVFGWVVGGTTKSFATASPTTWLSSFVQRSVKGEDKLNVILQKFIETEEVDVVKPVLTPEEQYCEDSYVENTSRGPDNKFIVTMPMKVTVDQLGRNLKNAYQMVYAQEGVRKKNETVNKLYIDYMNDYIDTSHMEEVSADDTSFAHYLPHHGVVKMSSTSTKLRPVCNASSKSETGISLNDVLCVGPVVQPESFDILLRFREKPFVLMGDITKMYRQIWIHPSQRKFLRILWRSDPDTEPIKHFQMKTVTFGTSCAPFLATRTIKQLAIENETAFAQAAAIIKNSIYVDDLLVGFNSIEEGRKIRDHIRYIFASAGMKLCKWSSNSPELLIGLPEPDVEASPDDDDNNIVKALGICCELTSDCFTYNLKSPSEGPVTKARVLSEIASVYDPIGWIGPVVLKGKLFMKQLWLNNLGWKELLSDEEREEWSNYRQNLPCLRDIKIKRHCIVSNPEQVELHGFCDASIEAYGACVYLRSSNTEGKVHVSLICAKSKVAPMKQQSLARLELCGALLLAKLVHRVLAILETSIDDVTLWCDSTIVLNWITMVSSKLHTFVGNRVAAIQQIAGSYRWRHISGHLTPADIISRGLLPQELASCELWWNGPEFLQLPKSQWPESIIAVNEDDVEVKSEVKKSLITTRESTMIDYIELRHSKTRTLVNVVAYLQRFAHNVHPKTKMSKNLGPMSIEERENAESTIIKIVQATFFPIEHEVLTRQIQLRKKIESGELVNDEEIPQISKKSSIISLKPFIDDTGLMRVGGRLEASNMLTNNQKHQIILPRCNFTSLFIRELHQKHLHPGPIALLSFVREKFWPLKAQSSIRKVAHDCLTCYRIKPIDTQQLMAPLPPARVNMAPPFTSTALDYAGYYTIRTGITKNSSTTKCYIAVFKCMCTGAIHLDLVSDLTSKAFITTFDRFVSRRGLCKELFTDNATCFEGADNELQDTIKKIEPEVQEHVIEQKIRWKFTTPRASHAGGIYESAVKSMKHHLKRVMVELKHTFTFEQLYSLLTKIEAILNSRPLTPMSEDINDLQVLTPGHFLVGRPLIAKPERNYMNSNTDRLNVFERLQQAQQHFWHAWYHDYLHTLQERPKNFREETTFKINDLVLLKDSNLPPLKWLMGRIVALFPGKDKVVRNVKVRTATGEKERHVKYLCLLPVEKA